MELKKDKEVIETIRKANKKMKEHQEEREDLQNLLGQQLKLIAKLEKSNSQLRKELNIKEGKGLKSKVSKVLLS